MALLEKLLLAFIIICMYTFKLQIELYNYFIPKGNFMLWVISVNYDKNIILLFLIPKTDISLTLAFV